MNTDAIAKRMAWIACCALTATVCAMPTKQQLAQAQPLVNDLTADDLRAMKAKEKTPGDVAAAHLDLANEAETEAGKYLLLQGAFKLYVRNADYDAAADVLARMRQNIADLPPEVVVELVNGEFRRAGSAKAEKVMVIYRDAQRMIKCRKQLASAEAAAQAKPGDTAIQRHVAECHAGLGDWAKALPIFAKLGDAAAKFELDSASAKGFDASKAADFWWNYPMKESDPFKVHAAVLYRKGLADGSISGLRKTLAEKRIKQMESLLPSMDETSAPARGSGALAVSGGGKSRPKTKMLDLGGGVKMEMIYVAPGSFIMGSDNGHKNQRPAHKVTFTKGYWLGKYEVTQKQWRQVMGSVQPSFKGDDLPVDGVTWEACQAFIKKVNKRLGGNMARLPTEAEWEYACRAGTDGDFAGTGRLDDMGWYKENCGDKTHPVGRKQANAWGFHDMHGNVWEWCGDWWGEYPQDDVSDPVGPSSGTERTFRGGSWGSPMKWCFSGYRWKTEPNLADEYAGFRLCMSADQEALSSRSPMSGRVSSPAVSAAPSAAKAPAPTTGPWAIPANFKVPLVRTLKLADDVTMDFCAVPAGTFRMSYPNGSPKDNQGKTHKVTITRSFWFSKTLVTAKQYRSFNSMPPDREAVCKGLETKFPNLDVAYGAWGGNINSYIGKLNQSLGHLLPKGYVFRLPTEAEWEYAYTEGGIKLITKAALYPEDKKRECEALKEKFLGGKGAPYANLLPRVPVNRLGIIGGPYSLQIVLDCIDVRDGVTDLKSAWKHYDYDDYEIDPLRLGSMRIIRYRTMKRTLHRDVGGSFRVVIGPDLMAEKKAGKK